jgi:hypothetical protein
MPHVYRITKGAHIGGLVDSTEALVAFARANGPGRYQIDQHSLDAFRGSNAKARGWGTAIHQPDGEIAVKPFFFGNHCITPDGRPQDVKTRRDYRGAYEHAARVIELARSKHTLAQNFANHVGHLTGAIYVAVMRETDPRANANVVRFAVEDAIADAIAGRQPQW